MPKRKALDEIPVASKVARLDDVQAQMNEHLATIIAVQHYLQGRDDAESAELGRFLEQKKIMLEDGSPPEPLAKPLLPPRQPPPPPTQPAAPSPDLVDTKQYVFSSVWPLVVALHENQPNHPMFGPVAESKIRAPLQLPGGKGAATSWHMKIKKLAANVEKNMGARIPPGSCWLVKEDSTHIQSRPPDGGELKRLVSFKTARLPGLPPGTHPLRIGVFSQVTWKVEKFRRYPFQALLC